MTRGNGAYESLTSLEALAALQENYGTAGAIYKFWADWPQVVAAVVLGWERAIHHPAQLHYAWDLADGHSLSEALYQTTRIAADYLSLSPGGRYRVLDAGCGFGGCTTQLAQEHPTWEVTGVSIVLDQAHIATARGRRQHVGNMTILAANYLDLPYDDQHFDGIIALETFCHVPTGDKPRLAREMARLLSPGACLVVFDGYREDISAAATPAYEQFLRGLALPALTTPQDLRAIFENEGLRTRQEVDATDRIIGAAHVAGRRARRLRPIMQHARGLEHVPLLRRALRATGWDAQSALDFADAAISQELLFERRHLRYYVHVFKR